MTYMQLIFCLTCLFLGNIAQLNDLKSYSSVRQPKPFVSVKAGDSLILQCFYEDIVDARYYWYKKNVEKKLKLISTFYKFETKGTFHNEFNNNPRFMLDAEKGKNHLKITDVHISDSATYYCASSYLYRLEFAEGTTVSVEGSDFQTQPLIHQSASETIHLGGSVVLNCTVQTWSCDEEHSVYWYRNSEESHPGLLYIHGGMINQCERNPNTQTHTCVSKLVMKNLNVSHAGTYYCALVSCGEILFGNGTKLDLNYEDIYFWGGAFAFIFILTVLLAVSVCLMIKNSSKSPDFQGFSSLPTADIKGYRHAENLYCAASGVLTNRSLRQKDPTWSECVYYYCKKKK